MANSKSAQKRARQNDKRTLRNRAVKTNVKATRRALNTAIESGDSASAAESFRQFISAADRAAKRGVIHANAAHRLKGLYTKRVAALS
jgi:small subunit ribosomal protein S20